jgi:hypothetical protein
MTVAAQLDQLCIDTLHSFPSMPCGWSSSGTPLHPVCGNEQIRSSGAGMLLNMRTAKDDPVYVYRPGNIRAIA